jgi:6-phosphogluconolactonase
MASLFDKLYPYAAQFTGRIDVFWLDERIDQEKNYSLVLGQLQQLRNAGVSILWHPLQSVDVRSMTAEAQSVFVQFQDCGGTFDVIVLSAGEDCHIASLFPKSPLLHATLGTYALVSNAPKPPPYRVTVTPPLLLSAGSCFLFFVGDKTQAYEHFNNGETLYEDCPAKIALDVPNLVVLTYLPSASTTKAI